MTGKPLPPGCEDRLKVLMFRDGLGPHSAACWLRHLLGHPDELWLSELFKMARTLWGRAALEEDDDQSSQPDDQ